MVSKKYFFLAAAILCIQAESIRAQDSDRTAQLEARRELASIGIEFGAAALIDAVKNRDSLALSLLLDAGIDVNTPFSGQTALMVALESGAHEMIGTLIEDGADITATDSRGNTVLHAARNMETVGILVERGARVNARNHSGETALWQAVVTHQNRGVAMALLDAGATPDAMPDNEASELAHAFEGRDLELVQMLVAHGADVDAYARGTWPGEPNPYVGIYRGEKPPGTPTYWEGSLLFKAVYDNDIAMAGILLDLGASPNSLALNSNRETRKRTVINGDLATYTTYTFTYSLKSSPFMLAVQRERLALAERMLIAGANANAMYIDRFEFPNGEEDSDSYSPLSMAVSTDNAELVSLLLAHGADANAIPCILHQSAERANLDVLRLLIEAGVDVDAFCPFLGVGVGRTALEVVVSSTNPMPHIVKALIDGGADVNESSDSWLAIHQVVANARYSPDSYVRILELLVGAGANVNAISRKNYSPYSGTPVTPLLLATASSNIAMVKILIDACANLDIVMETERHDGIIKETALAHARRRARTNEREYSEIYDLLRRANRQQRQLGCQ